MEGDKTPSLKAVLDKLGLSDKDVLAVTLVGSRLWGTSNKNSDWDFLIVVKRSPSDKGRWTLHVGNYEAMMFTLEEFKSKLAAHSFLTLVPFWAPKEHRWKCVAPLNFSALPKLDKQALARAVEEETKRDWDVAAKKAGKGLLPAARKVLLHLLRMLRISVAAVKDVDHAPNLNCSEDLFLDLIKAPYGTWEDTVEKYEPMMNELLEELMKANVK